MDPKFIHRADQGIAALKRFRNEQAPEMMDTRIKDARLFGDDLTNVGRLRGNSPDLDMYMCPHIEEDKHKWMEDGRIMHIFQCGPADIFLCDSCVRTEDGMHDVQMFGDPNFCGLCAGRMRPHQVITKFAWTIGTNVIHSAMCLACEFHHLGISDSLRNILEGPQPQ